jgi:hypothetical protein
MLLAASCSTRGVPQAFRYLGQAYYHDIDRLVSESDFSSRYVMMEKLIRRIYDDRGIDDLRSFVHQYALESSEDPYISYYFLLLGDLYLRENSDLSAFYYTELLRSYPDVVLDGYSTHYRALERPSQPG